MKPSGGKMAGMLLLAETVKTRTEIHLEGPCLWEIHNVVTYTKAHYLDAICIITCAYRDAELIK